MRTPVSPPPSPSVRPVAAAPPRWPCARPGTAPDGERCAAKEARRWRQALPQADTSAAGELLMSQLFELASWPPLTRLPQPVAVPVARICALLWHKRTAGLLVPKLLGAPAEDTLRLLQALRLLGHVAPVGRLQRADAQPPATDPAVRQPRPRGGTLARALPQGLAPSWSVLVIGPVGLDKRTAVHTLSELETLASGAASDPDSRRLETMNLGMLQLEGHGQVRLYGASDRDRFGFLWEMLLGRCSGVLLLLDHRRRDPLADLEHYLGRLRAHRLPVAIGVAHAAQRRELPLRIYRDHLQAGGERPLPVLEVDVAHAQDMRTLLTTLALMREMGERFAPQGG